METKEKNRTKNKKSASDKMSGWLKNNPKLNKALDNTGYYIKHPEKFTEKVNEIYKKATNSDQDKPLSELTSKVKALYRMVKMGLSGEYTGIPKGRLILGLIALAYLISPVDILPDALPFFGFLDDAAMLIWLVKAANEEVEKFEQWERTHSMQTT